MFTGAALLPGDYLAQMSPWNTIVKPSAPAPQWNPLQWDAIAQFYPWRVFYARSMTHGQIPLWNPYQFSGMPFLADGQSAVLYPGSLVFLVFDPITGFTVFAVLHLFLASAFMYLFLGKLGCRPLGRTVGAACFTFCAFMVLWLELPTFVSAAVWLPLVLFLVHRAVEKRSVFYGMLSGLALAMSFFAGHFQIAFYVAFATILWWLWRLYETRLEEGRLYTIAKIVPPMFAFGVIFGLIIAAQMLPSMEFGSVSHRTSTPTPDGYKWFIGNSLHTYRLITAFVPDFFGNPSMNTYFLGSAADYIEYGLYIGILPLMLALLGLTRVLKQQYIGFFALLALLAILTATGTPINFIFYYLIPGFSSLGGPNRILMLYFFGIAGLAAFGADYFVEHAQDMTKWRRHPVSLGAIATICSAFAMFVVFAIFHSIAVAFVERLTGRHFDGVVGLTGINFILLFFISALILIGYAGQAIKRTAFSVIAIVVILADLFAFGINYNPTSDRSKIYPKTELTTKLKQIAGDSYIAPINPKWNLYQTPKSILPPNAAMVYSLHDIQGYDSLYLRAYKDKISAAEGVDASPQENGNMLLVRRYTPDIARMADYAITTYDLAGLPGVRGLVGRWSGVNVYRLTGKSRVNRVRYEPFSFRFGLFLTLLGISGLFCAGLIHFLKKHSAKQ